MAVRFVKKQHFAFERGVVRPVASRIAEQMQAAQVIHFSKAAQIGDYAALKTVEKERMKLRQYAQLLENDEK